MIKHDTVIAVFPDHLAAEAAVKQLTAAGLAMKSLSIVGKGYHTEEQVVGFYNVGDVTVHTPLPSGCQLRGDAGQR